MKTSRGRTASFGKLFLELNLKEKRWLLNCSYNPSKENIKTHLETLSRSLALYFSSYDNVMVLGDFVVGVEEVNMSNSCQNFLVDIISVHTLLNLYCSFIHYGVNRICQQKTKNK